MLGPSHGGLAPPPMGNPGPVPGLVIWLGAFSHTPDREKDCLMQKKVSFETLYFHKYAFQYDAYRPLIAIQGGFPNRDPLDKDPPDRNTPGQRPPGQTPPGHVTCGACWDRDPPP